MLDIFHTRDLFKWEWLMFHKRFKWTLQAFKFQCWRTAFQYWRLLHYKLSCRSILSHDQNKFEILLFIFKQQPQTRNQKKKSKVNIHWIILTIIYECCNSIWSSNSHMNHFLGQKFGLFSKLKHNNCRWNYCDIHDPVITEVMLMNIKVYIGSRHYTDQWTFPFLWMASWVLWLDHLTQCVLGGLVS